MFVLAAGNRHASAASAGPIAEIDRALPGDGGREKYIRFALTSAARRASAEAWPVFAKRLGRLVLLQQLGESHDAGQRIVQFVAKPPIICPIAAKRSLWMICMLQFLFQGNVCTETITPFIYCRHRTAGLPLPAWCASFHHDARSILAEAELLRLYLRPDRARLARESGLQIFELLSQKIFRVVAKQVTNARADKAVSFIRSMTRIRSGKLSSKYR